LEIGARRGDEIAQGSSGIRIFVFHCSFWRVRLFGMMLVRSTNWTTSRYSQLAFGRHDVPRFISGRFPRVCFLVFSKSVTFVPRDGTCVCAPTSRQSSTGLIPLFIHTVMFLWSRPSDCSTTGVFFFAFMSLFRVFIGLDQCLSVFIHYRRVSVILLGPCRIVQGRFLV